ncbi:undecaprenyl-diphosphate phosphatase [Mollicutes bacterium LVI A0039]|nr:undecaprenyl-diphosphate phosphatase [Mollicutes bacterium LVI A0039]
MSDGLLYILLGIIQGFTEPLPISSSGHVAIFSQLFGLAADGIVFEAFINFGSTIAIVIYFWPDIKKLFFGGIDYLKSGLKENTEESNYLWKIFWATIPMVIVTLIMMAFDIELGDNLQAIGISLFITSMSLFFVSKKSGNTTIRDMSFKIAILIGVGQAIALMPGISRSGMTMVFALALGLRREDAFNFSFMMFIPASIGALIYSLIEIATSGDFSVYYLVSAFFAFIFTAIGIVLTKKFVMASKLHYFAIYCLIVSITIIMLTI